MTIRFCALGTKQANYCGAWTDEEDEALRKCMLKDEKETWEERATSFTRRTAAALQTRWKKNLVGWLTKYPALEKKYGGAGGAGSCHSGLNKVTFNIKVKYKSSKDDAVLRGASLSETVEWIETLFPKGERTTKDVEMIHLKRSCGSDTPAESRVPGIWFNRINDSITAQGFKEYIHDVIQIAIVPAYTGFSDASTLAGSGELGLRRDLPQRRGRPRGLARVWSAAVSIRTVDPLDLSSMSA